MKNTNKKNKNVKNNDTKKQSNVMQNPVNTIQGKILIWTLIVLMVGGSLIGLIAALMRL